MSFAEKVPELMLVGDPDGIECDGDACVLGFKPSFTLEAVVAPMS